MASMIRPRSFAVRAAGIGTVTLLGFALHASARAQETAATSPPQGEPRAAEVILGEIESVEFPTFDRERRSDQEYVDQYLEARNDATHRRNALIWELYRADPSHDRIAELLADRWGHLLGDTENADSIREEVGGVLEAHPGGPLAVEGLFALARIGVRDVLYAGHADPENPETPKARGWEAVEAFLAAAPQDARGGSLLHNLARGEETGSEAQIAIYERIQALYPDTRMARSAAGNVRRATSVGKPFVLEFEDAISGRAISMEDLRDQVVVIDFWATWCGPCIAEMPHMKELYATYHHQGVEFLGISLDQAEEDGGLQKLRDYVAQNEIPWPQYYQGAGWDSEFSTSWGIDSIPSMFVVDKQGVLRSIEAGGRLEKLIPELLAEE